MRADFTTILTALHGDPSGIEHFDDSDVTTDRAVYPQ
jgi:hypothetical protein